MSRFTVPADSPPDAATAPEGATDQSALDKRLASKRTAEVRHDPATCATCLGYQPWTSSAREEARSIAWQRRRLSEVST